MKRSMAVRRRMCMNIADIMTTSPVTVMLNKPLRVALELMAEHGIKHLPVISKAGHVVGVISDRDCRHALNSPFASQDPRQLNVSLSNQIDVRAVMSPAPIVVEPDAPASEAARLMLTHRIGCLPVMRGETLVGIVTRSDLLMAFINLMRRLEMIDDQQPHADSTG